MLNGRNSGDRATGKVEPASVPRAAAATAARPEEGVKVGRRSRFVQGVFSLKLPNNPKKLMARPAAGRGTGGGGGGGERYRRTFEEEHSCKQPLLVKSHDGDSAGGAPTGRTNFGGVPAGFHGDARRSDSWKASDGADKAEQERYDAAEARGYGLYSLHALIGQGTFGRIHLASWQHRGSGLQYDASSEQSREACVGSQAARAFFGPKGKTTLAIPDFDCLACAKLPLANPRAHRLVGDVHNGACFYHAGGWGSGWWRSNHVPKENSTLLPTATTHSLHRSSPPGKWRNACTYASGSVADCLPLLCMACLEEVSAWNVGCPCCARSSKQGELAVLKQCSHPFIVSLSPGGQFQTSGHLHLVLNYCPGGDLFSLLERVGRLPEQQVRVCAAQLALALRHLHGKHIAYRDLKPDNVCIDARGHAVLVDFSLARRGLDTAPGGKAYTFCGSAAYAAPEIIRKEGHDTRVDLWSLGCVVYEALVGEHPFRRPRGEKMDRHALFDRIQLGRLDYPSSLSASAVSLLRGLLSLDPEDRPGFVLPPSSSSRTPSPPPPPPPPSAKSDGRQQGARDTSGVTAATATARPTAPSDLRLPPPPPPPPPRKASLSSLDGSDSGNPKTDGFDGKLERATAAAPAAAPIAASAPASARIRPRDDGIARLDSRRDAGQLEVVPSKPHTGPPAIQRTTAGSLRPGGAAEREPPRRLLLEHVFFRGLPGWGGPGTGGAWEDAELEGVAVAVPALFDPLDVRHFDSRFTSQTVELSLQGHPHKGGPTPAFEGFEWRDDNCIEYAQPEVRRASSLFESLASALWC
ncbi:unnamed protein product [Scytosiphon promiscuus]